ncbi:origin recognition complex subunit 4 C-terminus-domain-containing protein [Lactarius hengduanensis]|nr:origin recognition complex subunit 4 C-terminus-domain-containing protein [Lactarius hengduanensis]
MPAKRKATTSQTLDEPDATRRRTRSNAANLSSPSRESQLKDPNASQPLTSSVRRRAPNRSTRSVPSPSPTGKGREKLLTRSQAKAPLVVHSETPHADFPSDQEDAQSDDELLLSPNRKKKRQETASLKPSQLPRVYVEIVSPARHPSKRPPAKTRADPSSPTPTRPKVAQRAPPSSSRSPTSLKKTIANRMSPSKLLGQSAPRGTQSSIFQNSPGYGYSPWCLHAQKRSIFHALNDPKTAVFDQEDENGAPSANAIVLEQLKALFTGTLERGEGNSCLLIGPRGSGKSRLLDEALASLPSQPIIIRLSGHVQHNDRLALREIARQLSTQTGRSFDIEVTDMDDESQRAADASDHAVPLPPPTYLPTLISALPTLARPTVLILEAFDLFAIHGRQALLYCLLDTAQSCRAGKGSKGIAVIGVTTRVDTINLLEKRVKSRFSGRMLRTAGPSTLDDWMSIARNALTAKSSPSNEEWEAWWAAAVEKFLDDRSVQAALSDTYDLTKDVRILNRILMDLVLNLSPTSPLPNASRLSDAIASQRFPAPFPFLSDISYPAACLLIASVHADTAGHESITFEMLHDSFQKQVRTSQSAPVQIGGSSIGMVRCSKEVLMTTFEQLIATKVFVAVTPIPAGTMKQFVRYKCMVEKEGIRQMVSAIGQTNLNQWLKRSQ